MATLNVIIHRSRQYNVNTCTPPAHLWTSVCHIYTQIAQQEHMDTTSSFMATWVSYHIQLT